MSGEVASSTAPVAHGPSAGRIEANQPFGPRQLARLDEALTMSSRETGLTFSIYVGEVAEPSRGTAESLFEKLATEVDNAVLIVVSPGQRKLHIVTGETSAVRLPNRACALAALGMRAAFTNGDLTGGIVTGLRMLADAAGRP